MRESDTYQAILQEGRIDQARRLLFMWGDSRFGPPDDKTKELLYACEDLERLEEMLMRVLKVSKWREILRTP